MLFLLDLGIGKYTSVCIVILTKMILSICNNTHKFIESVIIYVTQY